MSLAAIRQQYRLNHDEQVWKEKDKAAKRKERLGEPLTESVPNPAHLEASPDLTQLHYVEDDNLATNVAQRYERGKFYTAAGDVLLAVNPYEASAGWEEAQEAAAAAANGDVSKLEPSPIRVAERAMVQLARSKRSQTLVLLGESGSGKTENARIVLRHVAAAQRRRFGAAPSAVYEQLLHVPAVLDAFGHAQTAANSNASRVGVFARLIFDDEGKLEGNSLPMTGVLLETFFVDRSRVNRQEEGERSYHIFYQIFKSPPSLLNDLRLTKPQDYALLRQSGTFEASGISDAKSFVHTQQAMEALGFSDEQRRALFRLVAGVLHLGNVEFVVSADGESVRLAPAAKKAVEDAAALFEVKAADLEDKLVFHEVRSGVQMVRKAMRPEEARHSRDNMARTVYQRIFQYVVAHINNELWTKRQRERNLQMQDTIKLQGERNSIKVFCRVRPLSVKEQKANEAMAVEFPEANKVLVTPSSSRGRHGGLPFAFDRVFDPQFTQALVFENVKPFVNSAVDGYHVCVFAYGQTGSGKTYTMEGTPQDRGVNYRALDQLFALLEQRKEAYDSQVSVSVVEIYNEQARDLLVKAKKDLDIRQTPEGRIHIPELTAQPVRNSQEVIDLMYNKAFVNRAVGATSMNEHSSRSHCLLIVNIVSINRRNQDKIEGRLTLVDLAGSESVKKSEASGDRLKEAQFINLSLSALGTVISALQSESKHVPYRNSKLTYLLKESLSGSGKVLMFCQVSPADSNTVESLASLQFAQRVSSVDLGEAKRHVQKGKDVDGVQLGVVDLFGFEASEYSNSFEQLFINYADEALQAAFTASYVEEEQAEYQREAILWERVRFAANADVVELLVGKPHGIYNLLDSVTKMAKGTDEVFLRTVFEAHRQNPRIARMARVGVAPLAAAAAAAAERDRDATLRGVHGFVVKHYAGDCQYLAAGFLRKNTEAAPPELTALFLTSNSLTARGVMLEAAKDKDKDKDKLSARAARDTNAAALLKQFAAVMSSLQTSGKAGTHFVHCLNPNQFKQPATFDEDYVKSQLRAHCVAAAVKMMRHGFPLRVDYKEIMTQYGDVLSRVTKTVNPDDLEAGKRRDFVDAVMSTVGVERASFRLGLTRIFFRADKQEAIDRVLSGKLEATDAVCKRIALYMQQRRVARLKAGVMLVVRLEIAARRARKVRKLWRAFQVGLTAVAAFLPAIRKVGRQRAVKTVQAFARAALARRRLQTRRAAVHVIKSAMHRHLERMRLVRTIDSRVRTRRELRWSAARRIQVGWRRVRARRLLRAELERRVAVTRKRKEEQRRLDQQRREREEKERLEKLRLESLRLKKQQEEEERKAREEKERREREEAAARKQREEEEAKRAAAEAEERRRREEAERQRREEEKTRELARQKEEQARLAQLAEEQERKRRETIAEADGAQMAGASLHPEDISISVVQRQVKEAMARAARQARADAEEAAYDEEKVPGAPDEHARPLSSRGGAGAAGASATASAAAGGARGGAAAAEEKSDGGAGSEPAKDQDTLAFLLAAEEEERRRIQEEEAVLRAAKMRHVLLTGGKFLKFGKQGNPHIRFVVMNVMGNVHWSTEAMDPRKLLPSNSFIKLSEVVKVAKGKTTPVFQRKVAKKADENLCFSIVTLQRTLDLQATSVHERDLWVRALESAKKDVEEGVMDMITGEKPSNEAMMPKTLTARALSRPHTIQVVSSAPFRPSLNRVHSFASNDAKMSFLESNGTQEFLMFQQFGKPQIVYVEVVKDTLFVGPNPKPSLRNGSKACLLREVQSVRPGKVTGVFQYRSIDALSPPETCFSVIFPTWTLDLQINSNDLRNDWVEALTYAVERAKQAAETQDGKDKVAAMVRRSMSYSSIGGRQGKRPAATLPQSWLNSHRKALTEEEEKAQLAGAPPAGAAPPPPPPRPAPLQRSNSDVPLMKTKTKEEPEDS